MGKKILVGITILLISALLAGWYFFSREARYFGTTAFRAVPENAAVIVRIPHLRNYASRSMSNPIWTASSRLPGISDLYQKLVFADSLLSHPASESTPLPDKDLMVIFGKENDHFWNLSVIELSSMAEKQLFSDFTEYFFSHKGAAKEKIKSDTGDLTSYSWNEGGVLQNYWTAFDHGLLLIGDNRQIVQEVMNQLELPPTHGSAVFEKANKTATGNIDLNIYINHKKLPSFARQLFSESFLARSDASNLLADWSEIDLSQKTNDLLFNGFSFTGDSLNHYLEIFLHQKPSAFGLASLLPAETSFFVNYQISDCKQFFRDYESLLSRNNELVKHESSRNEINALYGIDIQKIVADNLDGAAAMVFTSPDPTMPNENKYLIFKTLSGSRMEEALLPIILKPETPKRRGRSKSASPNQYRIDKETVFTINKTAVGDFGTRVFGSVFSDVATNYFTVYDNYLIMAASVESLGRFLRANVLKETLANDKLFTSFASGLSNQFSYFLWCSPGRALPFFNETFHDSLYKNLKDKIKDIRKIESVGWQIGTENGMIYNTAQVRYNPEVRESEATVQWKSHPGKRMIGQPQLVKNSGIVVQDSDNNLILIGSTGQILWRVALPGPIRSEIFQIDYFRDGQLQYFFNTDGALHLIDHNGKYIRNFPVKLHATATNGVAVIDYDRTKEYRFFIAGKDHKIYLYDKKGKIVTGWSSPKTEHDVIQPVQFFRVDNKDYIVFTDQRRAYVLDRKGKTRVQVRGDISFSHNPFTLEPASAKQKARLVTSDAKGTIISIGFDGSVKRLTLGSFSPDHYFLDDDIDADKKRDYLFLSGDSLVLFDQQENRIFSRKFRHPPVFSPKIFDFPDRSRKIGIADTTENRIYLVNSDGSICNGFPLEGNSMFTIDFQKNESGQFNIITGTPDGCLSNYRINGPPGQ